MENIIKDKKYIFPFVIVIALIASTTSLLIIGKNSNIHSQAANINADSQVVTDISADYPSYNKNSIVMNSDVIICGTKQAETTEVININIGNDRDTKPMNVKYSVSEFVVDKSIKGKFKKGDIIKVKQMEQTNIEKFKRDKKQILFLKEYAYDIPYSPINPTQGNIEFENDKVRLNNNIFDGTTSDEVINSIEKYLNNK